MNLCIFGSRTLSDIRVRNIILDAINKHNPDAIITSGETEGVCAVARDVAKQRAITLILKFADNEKYAAGKYYHRCIDILKESNFCIFIHDGFSHGTANEIKVADKLKVKYQYFCVSIVDDDESIWNVNLEWNYNELTTNES